jgi:hypothetical protein
VSGGTLTLGGGPILGPGYSPGPLTFTGISTVDTGVTEDLFSLTQGGGALLWSDFSFSNSPELSFPTFGYEGLPIWEFSPVSSWSAP